jgi:hypothetical protein
MNSLSHRQRDAERHRRVIELWQSGLSPAEIAKRVGYKSATNVQIIINANRKIGYAWRRRVSRVINQMLAGADPVQRKMILDVVV